MVPQEVSHATCEGTGFDAEEVSRTIRAVVAFTSFATRRLDRQYSAQKIWRSCVIALTRLPAHDSSVLIFRGSPFRWTGRICSVERGTPGT